MALTELVGLLSRWVHIVSSIALLGGVLFARQVLIAPQELELISRYARIFQAAIAGLLITGFYNLMTKAAVPPGYHAVFGMKFLLALHVFGITYLVSRPGSEPDKRRRHLAGVLISGALVLALGACLRFLGR